MVSNNPVLRPTNIKENSKRQATPTAALSQTPDSHDALPVTRSNTSGLNSPMDITQFNYDDHWQELEVVLDRVRQSIGNEHSLYSCLLFIRHPELVSDFLSLEESIHLVSVIHLL